MKRSTEIQKRTQRIRNLLEKIHADPNSPIHDERHPEHTKAKAQVRAAYDALLSIEYESTLE